jgi:hypothetical protein
MGTHLIDGDFQSDKYPMTPRGCVPLKCSDVSAQDLLFEYAQRRRAVDAEFSADLEQALRNKSFDLPAWALREAMPSVCGACLRRLGCEEKSVARFHRGIWYCALCGVQPAENREHVVDGRYVSAFMAAVMPLASRMAMYILSLENEPCDEPGLPNFLEWDALAKALRARLGSKGEPR